MNEREGASPLGETVPHRRRKGAIARTWARVGGSWIPRCYRCLLLGLVGAGCTSAVSRGHLCYRYGSPGHKMLGCRTLPNCPVCRNLKAPTTDHSLGKGNFCSLIGGVVSVGGSGGDNSSSAAREGFPRDSSGKPERVKKGIG